MEDRQRIKIDSVWALEIGGEEFLIFASKTGGEADWSVLTPAERRVCRLLLDGLSNAQIAGARGTSVRTVANQIASIFAKTKTRSRTELFVWSTSGKSPLRR